MSAWRKIMKVATSSRFMITDLGPIVFTLYFMLFLSRMKLLFNADLTIEGDSCPNTQIKKIYLSWSTNLVTFWRLANLSYLHPLFSCSNRLDGRPLPGQSPQFSSCYPHQLKCFWLRDHGGCTKMLRYQKYKVMSTGSSPIFLGGCPRLQATSAII